MTIGYPDNAITKEARAKAGGGYESAIEVAPVEPGINASGTVAHGEILTITDSEARFGTRTNVKPLYVNLGDGKLGSSLGRDTGDYFEAQAFYQTTVKNGQIAGGVSFNHDARGAAIFGNLSFDPDKPLTQYLERFRQYDITTDQRLSVLYVSKTGTINVGDILTGQTSGATGVVRSDDGTRIDFEVDVGTIRSGGPFFQNGETLQGPTGSVVDDDPFDINGTEGSWRTFNLKTNRNYAGPGALGPNNIYVGHQGDQVSKGGDPRIIVENVNGNQSDYSQTFLVLSEQWESEEILFENSSAADLEDGYCNVFRGSTALLTNAQAQFATYSTDNSNPIDTAYLDQVSNGVGKACNTIIGYQCWDDEYEGVYVGNASTRSACTKLVRQPQTSWSASQIKIQQVESQIPLASGHLYIRTGRTTWVNDIGVALQ